MNERIDDAVDYAVSSNKIEDLNLSKKELEEVKNAILEKKNSDSFVDNLTQKVVQDVKTK